jgi:YD repeat-containing protein
LLAAGVAAAGLDTHQGAGEAQGKKPHQGIFSKNRGLRVGEMWLKWSGTHQDRSGSWWQTVSGSALDANGNTLSDAQGRSYTWDFENRLTQVVNPGVGTTTFRYDPFGRRIQKISPTTTSIFVYDDSNLIETASSSGSVLARYTQGWNINEPLAMQRGSTGSFYEADGLSSITSLSNAAGALSQTYTYDSFGNTTNSSGSLTNFFRYTAREFDTGRLISEDPLRFQATIDFYPYALNNPIRWRDPDGRGVNWGSVYNWYEKARNTADLLNCAVNAKFCLEGLADTTSSIRNDSTIGSPDNPNSSASTGFDQIRAACKADENCRQMFCKCIQQVVSNTFLNPLAPPSWITDMFGPNPCNKK